MSKNDNEIKLHDTEIAMAFNAKPKNGIKIIEDICLKNGIEPVEEQIANFFHRQKNNLDLREVGDYLGTGGERNNSVLGHFTQGLNFEGKGFVSAYRQYLSSFHLPGEAQKIERIVDSFGARYKEQNPDSPIANKESAFVLAYSVTMLNTDLHNPNVKKHMTSEEFQRNNREINNGASFDKEFLEDIYKEIKKDEIKIKFNPSLPGYEFDSKDLSDNKTFSKTLNALSGKHVKTDHLSPMLHDVEFKVTKPKTWLSKLTGYSTTVIAKRNGGEAEIQIYKPGVFSKYIKRKHPQVSVIPSKDTLGSNREETLKLAASISANFGTPSNIKATYDYDKADLENAYEIEASILKVSKDLHKNKQQAQQTKETKSDKKIIETKNLKPGTYVTRPNNKGGYDTKL